MHLIYKISRYVSSTLNDDYNVSADNRDATIVAWRTFDFNRRTNICIVHVNTQVSLYMSHEWLTNSLSLNKF